MPKPPFYKPPFCSRAFLNLWFAKRGRSLKGRCNIRVYVTVCVPVCVCVPHVPPINPAHTVGAEQQNSPAPVHDPSPPFPHPYPASNCATYPWEEPPLKKCPTNLWLACGSRFTKNNGNHENDEDNSDKYKQGVECWISGNHGNHGNDKDHGNPGCKPQVPQTTGYKTALLFPLDSRQRFLIDKGILTSGTGVIPRESGQRV